MRSRQRTYFAFMEDADTGYHLLHAAIVGCRSAYQAYIGVMRLALATEEDWLAPDGLGDELWTDVARLRKEWLEIEAMYREEIERQADHEWALSHPANE